jgi:hypothetical protein
MGSVATAAVLLACTEGNVVERTAEYDAFGPWILPIRGADEVPRAFHEYPFAFASDAIIVKIPRDIERREANPNMHLYDRVLVLTDDSLTALERLDDGFTSASIATDAVCIVEFGSELLAGWLNVASVDGSRIEVPFNGSSRDIMATFVDRLLPRPSGSLASHRLELDALGPDESGLVNLYRSAARRRSLRILARHPGQTLKGNTSLIDRLRRSIPRLSGLVLCESDTELVFLGRRHWVRRSPKPDVSTRETIIVRRHLSSVSVAPSPALEGISNVTIGVGAASIELAVPTGNDALAVLQGLHR